MAHSNHLFLLGTGQVGKAVIAQAADGRRITATTRNPNRIFELADLKIEPLIMPLPSAEIVEGLVNDADILVSFPPDGISDKVLAPACSGARSIIYISSTGVYGKKSGLINDDTEIDVSDERMRPRVEAESIWREHGAVVLRAPGIYGAGNGLEKRIQDRSFKLPGDGMNHISRIHVEDLASIVLAIFDKGKLEDSTYLVGDEHPCPIAEVVGWLCDKLGLQLPESIPLSEASPTLKGNRSVDASRLMDELGIKLKYPSYRDGYAS